MSLLSRLVVLVLVAMLMPGLGDVRDHLGDALSNQIVAVDGLLRELVGAAEAAVGVLD